MEVGLSSHSRYLREEAESLIATRYPNLEVVVVVDADDSIDGRG